MQVAFCLENLSADGCDSALFEQNVQIVAVAFIRRGELNATL